VKLGIPRAKDTPDMEVITLNIPRAKGLYGACGADEYTVVPTASAIPNAIFHACEARIRDLPATKEKVKGGYRILIREYLKNTIF
jgi:CO/xanthine dehydrogenase Mo-binding subunit